MLLAAKYKYIQDSSFFLKKKFNIVLDNRFLWPILFCCGHAGGECNRIPREENETMSLDEIHRDCPHLKAFEYMIIVNPHLVLLNLSTNFSLISNLLANIIFHFNLEEL